MTKLESEIQIRNTLTAFADDLAGVNKEDYVSVHAELTRQQGRACLVFRAYQHELGWSESCETLAAVKAEMTSPAKRRQAMLDSAVAKEREAAELRKKAAEIEGLEVNNVVAIKGQAA